MIWVCLTIAGSCVVRYSFGTVDLQELVKSDVIHYLSGSSEWCWYSNLMIVRSLSSLLPVTSLSATTVIEYVVYALSMVVLFVPHQYC